MIENLQHSRALPTSFAGIKPEIRRKRDFIIELKVALSRASLLKAN
jgi:hypothetical protein